MTRGDTATLHVRAPPRTRRSFYHALAHAVAGAHRPAGAVFESVVPDRAPRVTVRPARLLADVLGASPGAYEPVELRPTCASPEPPSRSFDRVGVLAPLPPGAPELRETVPLVPPRLEQLLGPGGWLACQTFWLGGRHGTVWAARRFRYAAPALRTLDDRFDAVAEAVAYDWSTATGRPTAGHRSGCGSPRSWRRRSLGNLPRPVWLARPPDSLAATAETRWVTPPPSGGAPEGHAVVFGSSGAGKTTYLARRAAEAIARGERVVAIDLHGDLTPAVLAHLPANAEARVLAVDAGDRPVPGIAVLSGRPGDDRAAALLVAAVKRLSADGTDVYWGFRLERIFDTFVRLVQESQGTLLDLYDLLTSDDRREAARLATRRPELARFLEELAPVVRRNPDFLWSAATRLSKVVLVPALAELLAPADGGLPIEALVAGGRSLLVRLPFARLGPEAAALAGTLVLARVFLGLAGEEEGGRPAEPVLLVLDEVQGFSPRLVAEVLTESRKFGLRTIVATQYPERLAPEVRSAAAGASTHFVAFRVPPASAAEAGAWLGLDRVSAERLLPELALGAGVERDAETGALLPLPPAPTTAESAGDEWPRAVRRTRQLYGPAIAVEGDLPGEDVAAERLLLAVLAAEEEGAPLDGAGAVASALALSGAPLDPALVTDRWSTIRRRNWVTESNGRFTLASAGARWIGLEVPTGASRESAEHRRLLMGAFRVFARRGYRLEIVRQGRFDTTLPDARLRQLSAATGRTVPVDLACEIDRVRRGWAWRFFGGRDVHIEAEVSGALRPERVRHGWAKAATRGAFVVFVVGDAARARRVRSALARAGVGRDRAQVWTLRAATERTPTPVGYRSAPGETRG